MPLDSAWVTRSLISVVVGTTWDRCFAVLEIYEQTKNRPGLVIQVMSSWFAADLESMLGVFCNQWVVAGSCRAWRAPACDPPYGGRVKAQGEGRRRRCLLCLLDLEAVVRGPAKQRSLMRNSKGGGPRIEDSLDVLLPNQAAIELERIPRALLVMF